MTIYRENEHNFERENLIFAVQMTGAPLKAAKRMQFNLEMKPIPEFDLMKDMPEVIFPLFWVEETVAVGPDVYNQLKYGLFL